MNWKGALVGSTAYLAFGVLYALLASGGRGGDMPFGAEIFIWPVLMFPLGIVGLLAPAWKFALSNRAHAFFGSDEVLQWIVMAGNFALWGVAGGLIGSAFRRKGR